MTVVRRAVALGASTALLVASFATPAPGMELDDLLTEAYQSTYTASRLVVSVWGGRTLLSREFVERADGMEMVHRGAGWLIAGNGKAIALADEPGDEPTGVTFFTHQRVASSSRYTVIAKGEGLHMSRLCQIVEVMEGDVVRAAFIVDDRSGAILVQESFTGDGALFRRTTLSDFRAYRTYEAPTDGFGVRVEVVMPEAAILLPESLAGYQLVDAFSAPGSSEQGYYTDGLFSFSLFILSSRTVVSGFENPMAFVAGSGVYDMAPAAHAVSLYWSDGSNRFVLVGDLPPDHAVDVVDELPPPEARSAWARWWSRLFG